VKKTAAKGHTKKHAHATKKHAKTAKHHPTAHQLHMQHMQHLGLVHVKAKPAAHAKARALSPGDVACCGAEALAASLRLAGVSVTGADVLALHRLAGADDETGAPLPVLLEAAAEFGLAGCRPAWLGIPLAAAQDVFEMADGVLDELVDAGEGLAAVGAVHGGKGTGLILGVDLPGPHAVLATPDCWRSWGDTWCPCEFPDAAVEEAWAVSWS
jgi:hypothetical protein